MNLLFFVVTSLVALHAYLLVKVSNFISCHVLLTAIEVMKSAAKGKTKSEGVHKKL